MFDSLLPYNIMEVCLKEMKYRNGCLQALMDKKNFVAQLRDSDFFGVVSDYTREREFEKFIFPMLERIKVQHLQRIDELKKEIDSIWSVHQTK